MTLPRVMTRLGQLFALTLILTGSHAWGQTIVQTATFSGSGTGTTDYSFTSFDSSLGTLNSVSFVLENVTTSGSATIINISPYVSPPGYNENMSGGFTNSFAVTANTASSSGTLSVFITSAPLTSPQVVTPGSSFSTGTQVGTENPSPQSFTALDTSDFINTGTGTVTLNLAAQTSAYATGSAGTNTFYFGGSATAVASGTLELIYNYTPVPEPSQTAACMIGFALCVLVGRNYFKGRGFRLA